MEEMARFALLQVLVVARRHGREVADGGLGIAERQREEPEDLRRDGGVGQVAERCRLPLAELGVGACRLHAAEMRVDERAHAVTRRLVVPQLRAEHGVEAPARVRLRERPVPGAHLEIREQHQREVLVIEIAPRLCALELPQDQLAGLRELAALHQLEPEDQQRGVVARAARRLALQRVGPQQQLPLDALAGLVSVERDGAQRLREQEGEPGRFRPRGSRLQMPARPLRLAAHLREQ
jgi:hypothetical protein